MFGRSKSPAGVGRLRLLVSAAIHSARSLTLAASGEVMVTWSFAIAIAQSM